MLSSVFGAAIRTLMLPVRRPVNQNPTPSFTTIAASPKFGYCIAFFRVEFAIPSPIPVVLSSSLAYTCFLYASLSLIFSLFTMRSTIWSSASALLFDASKRILLASSKSCDSHMIFLLINIFLYTSLCLTPAAYILLLLPVWLPDIRKMHWRCRLQFPYGKHAHNPAFPSSLP